MDKHHKKCRTKFSTSSSEKNRKTYRLVVLGLCFLIAFSVYQWPEKRISQNWSAIDKWLVEERLGAEGLTHESAINSVKSWIGESADTPQAEADSAIYQLKKEYNGGNLRESPVTSFSKDNVIFEITQDTELIYLNQSKTVENTLWIKVKVENGDIGWISKNIVEEASD